MSVFSSRPLYVPPFYDDVRFYNILRKRGVSDPTDINYKGDIIPCFNQGDELGFHRQLPHGLRSGEALDLHVHWTPHTRGVAENAKTVAWKAELCVVELNGVVGAQTVYDLTDTCTGVDNAYLITANAVVAGPVGLSALVIGRVYRDVGDTWVGVGANGPALLEADFHGAFDMPGSRQEYVK